MRKTERKPFYHILLMMAVCCLLCALPAREVRADKLSIPVKNNFKITTYLKENAYFHINASAMDGKNVTDVKVVSGKKTVATVKKVAQNAFMVIPKKTGTSAVTVTAKIKGKKVTYKGTVTVVKFANPFRSLKVNGKEYRSRIVDSTGYFTMTTDKNTAKESSLPLIASKNVKLTYKLQSGWKVVSSSATYTPKGSYSPRKLNVKIKSGATWKITNNMDVVNVLMQLKNTKTGAEAGMNLTVLNYKFS